MFLDADKENYLSYAERIMDWLKPSGVIIADDVNYYADKMGPFLKLISGNSRIEAHKLDIGHGVLVAGLSKPRDWNEYLRM